MGRQNILRAFLFLVFFGVGATAVSISMLCEELLQYYCNKQQPERAKEMNRRLESLIDDYDALLEQLREDPNLVRRVAPAYGAGRQDQNTVYPKVTPEELDAARKALMEDTNRRGSEAAAPEWLVRCGKPRQRTVLFVAGGFLVLISFMWFGPTKRGKPKSIK